MAKTLFLQPLAPALILLIGGLALWLGNRLARWYHSVYILPTSRLAEPTRRSIGRRLLMAILTVAAASAVLLLLRMPSSQANLRWTWQPLTVAGSTLHWRLDGWNWLVGLLLLLLTAVALLLSDVFGDDAGQPGQIERTLWLGAAALAFVFAANTVTLASCWVLLDTALMLRMGPDERIQPGGRAWGLLSLAGVSLLGVLALQGESGIQATLPGGSFNRMALGLLWLVGLVRAGVYPLHFWLTASSRLSNGTANLPRRSEVTPSGDLAEGGSKLSIADRVALHLIVPTTGFWLLGRVHEVAGTGSELWLRRPEWASLGAMALLGTALAAWTTENPSSRWRWIAINRASLVVMAAYVADAAGPQVLVWSLVTFALGSGLLAVGQAIAERWGWRLPTWLGALALWGVPGMPGFLARSGLVFPTELATAVPLFGVLLVAETVLVAALWEAARGDHGERAPDPRPRWPAFVRLGLALLLLAVPLLTWGLVPRQLASAAALPAGDAFPPLSWMLTHARRSVWGGLVVSGLAGIALGIWRRNAFVHMRGWQQGISAIVSLDWLYRAVVGGLALFGAGLRYFAALGEGEGYLGWLATAAIILWVLLRG